MKKLSLILVCLLMVAAAACSKHKSSSPCDGVTCSGHGICSDSSGRAVCTCDDGYVPSGTLECAEAGSVDELCKDVQCDEWKYCSNGDCVLIPGRTQTATAPKNATRKPITAKIQGATAQTAANTADAELPPATAAATVTAATTRAATFSANAMRALSTRTTKKTENASNATPAKNAKTAKSAAATRAATHRRNAHVATPTAVQAAAKAIHADASPVLFIKKKAENANATTAWFSTTECAKQRAPLIAAKTADAKTTPASAATDTSI